MIPTISTYLWEVQHNRRYWQDKLDKRRCFVLTLSLFTVVTVGVLAFILR